MSLGIDTSAGFLACTLYDAAVHFAGGVTLEDFFRRIPKQDTHSEQQSPPSGTEKQAGGASSAVKPEDAGPSTPAIPGGVQRRVQTPAGCGHAGDSPEARRERLLLAVQQRMEVMVGHFGLLHVVTPYWRDTLLVTLCEMLLA